MHLDREARNEVPLFLAMALIGLVAESFHVRIPHTEVFIEGRWVLGFLGIALLRHWWLAALLTGLLCLPLFSDVPWYIGFGGNLLYAVPSFVAIRAIHPLMVRKLGPGLLLGLCWVLLVLVCYQLFITPAVWAVLGAIEGVPVGQKIIEGWKTQPYLVESVLVALFTALGVVVFLMYRRLRLDEFRHEESLRRQLNRARSIASASAELLKPREPKQNIEKALQRLREASGVARVYVFEHIDGSEHSDGGLAMKQSYEACAPGVEPQIDNPMLQHCNYRDGYERWRKVLSTGGIIRGNVSKLPDHERKMLELQGIRSILVLPLYVLDVWQGFIGFDETRHTRTWGEDEIAILRTGADLIGSHIGRIRTDDAMRKSREHLSVLGNMLDTAPVTVTVHDPSGEFFYANRHTIELHGYDSEEEFMRLNLHDLDVPESEALINERVREIRESGEARFEVSHYRKDGSTIPLEIIAKKIEWEGSESVMSIGTDISERKRTEAEKERLNAQLAQSQKMESVGRLAGGVAHDFNNMLGVIIGHVELVLADLACEDSIRQSIEEIGLAAQRSADLTRQLLAFARRQTVIPKVIDLNQTVESMLNMLERLIGEHIELVWDPAPEPEHVLVDPTQIDQLLANLLVNARDAIGRRAGRVTIATGATFFDEEFCEDHPGAEPGRYILLAISDDGCGMDEETREQVFEPFFTTKRVGEGTGLGLATVYGIVKQNNGFIDVLSTPGEGSMFRVCLPACDPGSPPDRVGRRYTSSTSRSHDGG